MYTDIMKFNLYDAYNFCFFKFLLMIIPTLQKNTITGRQYNIYVTLVC